MKKFKKMCCAVSAVLSLSLMLWPCLGMSAPGPIQSNVNIEARGILTSLTLSTGGGNGSVWASVKNNFTLFPSVIIVYLELYSSYEYTEDYTEMTCVARVMTGDLDQGHTLETSAPTNGEQKYWSARARYKFDNRDWVEKLTPVYLRNGKGEAITS